MKYDNKYNFIILTFISVYNIMQELFPRTLLKQSIVWDYGEIIIYLILKTLRALVCLEGRAYYFQTKFYIFRKHLVNLANKMTILEHNITLYIVYSMLEILNSIFSTHYELYL